MIILYDQNIKKIELNDMSLKILEEIGVEFYKFAIKNDYDTFTRESDAIKRFQHLSSYTDEFIKISDCTKCWIVSTDSFIDKFNPIAYIGLDSENKIHLDWVRFDKPCKE